jgi:hypothetical protein
MTMTKSLGTIVFAVAMTFLVAGPVVAQPPDLAAEIAAAKTAADHCHGESKCPHLWEAKSPHPRVHSVASVARTRPALSLSFRR